jgi:hypothetical protein
MIVKCNSLYNDAFCLTHDLILAWFHVNYRQLHSPLLVYGDIKTLVFPFEENVHKNVLQKIQS